MKARQAARTSPRLCGGSVGRHAHRDAAGAVDQQVREARRQDLRLALAGVIVRLEVDGILVDVAEQEIGDLGEAGFRVAHGRRRIGVHRAEIALAVDQRHAHRPVLGHPGEGVVDRLVAMRVIFTHDVTDDAARLAILAPGNIARLLAGVEDPAMDRLQTVAHVGQRAADDYRHGIVEVAGLHLLDDGDGGNVTARRRDLVVGRRLGRQGKSCRSSILGGHGRIACPSAGDTPSSRC